MTVLRAAFVAAIAVSVASSYALARAPSSKTRMPSLPTLGATSAHPTPSLPAVIRHNTAGVAPARLVRTLRAVAEMRDAPPTRGGLEQRLYETYARSVVLVVMTEGLGSGTVIGKDGLILTNWHVAGGLKSVGVVFKPLAQGAPAKVAEAVEAKVLFVDEVADLALIKVAELPADVKPFAIGDHLQLKVGADVHAIGHPIGEAWSYTKGIVSQIHANYDWETETGAHRADVVQTQTPINPGNSGGPLLNDKGEVVGINTFGNQRAQLINFAVAATEIRRFVALRADRLAPPPDTAPDQLPPTMLPRAKGADASCKVVKLETRRTANEDGTAHVLDTTCDGVMDAILIVPDSKRTAVELIVDSNQNKLVDAVYVDEDHDFKFDYVLFDTDEDGVSDLLGVDLDQDLNPGRIVAMKA